MFILQQKPSYFWPVTVKLPKDGGDYDKATFDVEFKRLTQERLKEIDQEIKKENSEITDLALCHEIVIGWKGIVNDDKSEIPFSHAALTQILDIPMVAASIVESFFQSIAGAKRKN